jgi:hypothetical protein
MTSEQLQLAFFESFGSSWNTAALSSPLSNTPPTSSSATPTSTTTAATASIPTTPAPASGGTSAPLRRVRSEVGHENVVEMNR